MSPHKPKLMVVTDAWAPQTNGVVTTLQSVLKYMPALGLDPTVIHPGQFNTVGLPSYPEIKVAANPWKLRQAFLDTPPDAVHIATEGPLGMAARRFCQKNFINFTTSLHTKFPEYAYARWRVPLGVGYKFLRWFHAPAHNTLCTTPSHVAELSKWGLEHLVVWGRGVDTTLFQPCARVVAPRCRPRLLYVGRVAVEKNLEAFLSSKVDADKVVVGDGPARPMLQAKYPEAQWLGYKKGIALVKEYASADVFVFPSKTDTFGLVMLEAMACGTPVAAYPVTGPIDVVQNGVNGVLHEDLDQAIHQALLVNRKCCRAFAEETSWQQIAQRMKNHFYLL